MLLAPNESADALTWAKWWIAQGWFVFPVCSPAMGEHTHGSASCKPGDRDNGKAPLLSNGFHGATDDVTVVEQWWARWPLANIAGTPPVDHFVVDIDGETSVNFPDTFEVSTGKGSHKLFKQNTLNPVPQGQRVWPNVDTRLNGKGYCVLPPSLHGSGVRYAIAAQRPVLVFPTDLKPVKGSKPKGKAAAPTGDETVISALLKPGDDPTAGDDDMIRIAGYLARYIPERDVYCAMLCAINARLDDPLSDSAMDKKYTQWDRHREVVALKADKALDDEARGWLVDRAPNGVGYDTPIEGRDGTISYMPITDFTMRATGVIIAPGYAKRVFIVDCIRADGETLVGQKIDTDTMCELPRLRRWLARRGLNTYDHRKDPRGGSLGLRLIKMLESQEPVTLESRDHYGWCPETQAFLIEEGEVTADGLRGFTKVYPDDKLRTDAPTAFNFDSDITQARDWLNRVLGLQPEREAAKVGAWLMMLMLRGQWTGLLPGLLVQASAGTGKTRFFQLLFKLIGSTNEGESLTVPAMRDKLLGNTSNAVWLDDVALDDRQQQLMRGSLTNGKITLKTQSGDGAWETVEKHMRASIVVSGEGVDWYRQKALRDRFIEVNFDTSIRTPDADKLVSEDIGRGSGALLMAVLGVAHMLPELEWLRTDVKTRDDHARTTLRQGARVLDAVMGTGAKWALLVDDWYRSDTADNLGQASEAVLQVFPILWHRLGRPESSGQGSLVRPIWYDAISKTFWVQAAACADAWLQTQKGLNDRQRQLAESAAITRELDACGAGPSTNKPTLSMHGTRKQVKYRQLPVEYSAHILRAVDHAIEEDDNDDSE